MEGIAILEMIKIIGAATGGILSIITLLTMIFKVPKKWFNNEIKKPFDDLGKKIDEKFDRIDKEFIRIDERFKNIEESFEKVNETDLCILRHSITVIYEEYKKDKKIPTRLKEDLFKLHENYKNKGGNSYIEDIWREMKHWEEI